MADTRTIFLLSDKNIYCSDPNLNENGNIYLDLSDFDSLNPTLDLSVAGNAMVSSYQPYEVSMTATFKGRGERAEWVQKNAGKIRQIAVANTSNQNRLWNKKAALTGVEFVENPYVNGVQSVLKFKLFGKWQSTLTEIPTLSGVYSGGTKSYSLGETSPNYYVYNSELRYGSTAYTSALDLGQETGFVVVATRGAGLSINIQGGDTLLTLESGYSELVTGFSSEYVAYPYTAFNNLDKFTILEGGTLLTYGWNIEPQEMPVLYDLLNNSDTTPLAIGALNQLGKPVPVNVYGYTQQDFI